MGVVNLAEVAAYNKALLDKYPFLWPCRDGERIPPNEFRYMTTVLDRLPRGYAAAFGDKLVDSVASCLEATGANGFLFVGFSLGAGRMRVLCNMEVPGLGDVLDVFEWMSERICCVCGSPASLLMTTFDNSANSVGSMPFCAGCRDKIALDHTSRGMSPPKSEQLNFPEWRRDANGRHEVFDGHAWVEFTDSGDHVDTDGGSVVE